MVRLENLTSLDLKHIFWINMYLSKYRKDHFEESSIFYISSKIWVYHCTDQTRSGRETFIKVKKGKLIYLENEKITSILNLKTNNHTHNKHHPWSHIISILSKLFVQVAKHIHGKLLSKMSEILYRITIIIGPH